MSSISLANFFLIIKKKKKFKSQVKELFSLLRLLGSKNPKTEN
jgi:hypothetical protein